jgi:hypothetical protein
MKRFISIIFVMVLVLSLSTPLTVIAAPLAKTIPTFTTISVFPGTSVTIRTYNFPAHDSFDVLMGPMGTRGVNGIKVATIGSGTGGSFTATFSIPNALKGSYQIALRLQSNTGSGYFAYNWFYNNSSAGPGGLPGPGGLYTGIPTIWIAGVVRDQTVTITTYNFPSNDSFDVLMNYMGTRGKNGIFIGTVSSNGGGTLTYTFNIPAILRGLYQIAIRLQSNTGSGYFAYNWFYNNTTGSTGGGGTLPPGYVGFPTFSVVSVLRDTTVTIQTYNLPPDDQFKVLMGPIGTRGIHGYYVTTINSGVGGVQTLTFNIPPQLAGSHRIAIRLQSVTGSGYYAYNWFYNNTTH